MPDFLGCFITKRAMEAAFKVVACAAGGEVGARITGHSPRVTGAQLMAQAGISEWRIQVFGRWGSAAILGYLRDSLISGAAGALAQEVVHAHEGSRRNFCVADLMPLLKADAVSTQSALERVASKCSAQSGVEHQDDAVQSLRAELLAVQAELASVSARTLPEVVACARSGKVHVVANACVTHCGWMWSSHPNSYRIVDGGVDRELCKKCCSRADRLKRVVSA